MSIFRYEGIYVGLPAIFYHAGKGPDKNQDGFHHIQLACSRDLNTWRRLGRRQAFIGPSAVGPGVFDNTQILPPTCPVVRGDELWFYYTGTQHRYTPKGKVSRGAICLAVLRRDGFMSLDAGDQPGYVLTRPFTLPVGDLHLNANAARGSITVQVCDEKGKALEGYAGSAPLRSDRVGARVSWAGGQLKALAGKKICLRIQLRKATIYSYWFK